MEFVSCYPALIFLRSLALHMSSPGAKRIHIVSNIRGLSVLVKPFSRRLRHNVQTGSILAETPVPTEHLRKEPLPRIQHYCA